SHLVGKEFWLVMEYVDRGTLKDVISETHRSAVDIAAATWDARDPICLYFLHSSQVKEIRRDVKSCHILLITNSSFKLVDFGLFALLTPEQSRWSSVASTSGWMVPEVVTGQPYGPKMDTEQEVPYRNETPVSAQLLTARGGRPQLRQPNRCSPCLRDFLSCCLQTDVTCRWSAKRLLEHSFVTSAKQGSTLASLIISVKRRTENLTL
ncbi:PAK1 kinase, partial [Prunella himalayana]|nr:PAK1 kinase [Prunella himalayana]